MSGPASEKFPQNNTSMQDLAFSYRHDLGGRSLRYHTTIPNFGIYPLVVNNLAPTSTMFASSSAGPSCPRAGPARRAQSFRALVGGFLQERTRSASCAQIRTCPRLTISISSNPGPTGNESAVNNPLPFPVPLPSEDCGHILQSPPTDDSISLSAFGGEGWGEEVLLPGSRSRPHPFAFEPLSPTLSRAPLAGRGRSPWWQCQGASEDCQFPGQACGHAPRFTPRAPRPTPRAFTLVEILVTVALLSFIVAGPVRHVQPGPARLPQQHEPGGPAGGRPRRHRNAPPRARAGHALRTPMPSSF